tara:strand:+ start:4600 stop:5187 length:588 start_codon:yes stop_codon:yes gene_type:complete
MDSGGIATTSLDELPTPSSENVQLVTHDKPSEQENVVVKNETNTAEQIRERDNELITGIQKASANGMLELPSRDIPMDKMAVTADNQVKANYVPSQSNDYITEHVTSEEIIRQNAKKQQTKDAWDDVYAEISLPLLIAVFYFMYQLPAVRKAFMNTLPMCYGKGGDINLTGRLINCLVFGAVIYASSKLVSQISK